MLRRRPLFARIASCAFLSFSIDAALASDLTLFGWKQGAQGTKPAASKQKPDATRTMDDKSPAQKQDRKKGKPAHADSGQQRRIITYSLLRDPLFRNYAATSEAKPAERMIVTGTGIGAAAVPLALPQAARKTARAEPFGADNPDTSGIAFGCRERPFSSHNRREFTACFRHNVDRSWKTQTYVSRGVREGAQTWGGGLTIAYDY